MLKNPIKGTKPHQERNILIATFPSPRKVHKMALTAMCRAAAIIKTKQRDYLPHLIPRKGTVYSRLPFKRPVFPGLSVKRPVAAPGDLQGGKQLWKGKENAPPRK